MRNNPVKYVDPSGHFWWFFIGLFIAALIGGVIGGFASFLQGGSFWQGFGIGAAVAVTVVAAQAAAAAAVTALLGQAAAASTLGQLGILTAAGALGSGVGESLQGGSFGHGALVGGVISAATFGFATIAGPAFQQLGSQLSEIVGPKIGQALAGFAESSAGQQLTKFLNKVGLGSQGAKSALAFSEDTIPAGNRLLVPGGAINAPTTFTKSGESFVRVAARPEKLRFSYKSPGGAQAETYPEKRL